MKRAERIIITSGLYIYSICDVLILFFLVTFYHVAFFRVAFFPLHFFLLLFLLILSILESWFVRYQPPNPYWFLFLKARALSDRGVPLWTQLLGMLTSNFVWKTTRIISKGVAIEHVRGKPLPVPTYYLTSPHLSPLIFFTLEPNNP